MDVYTLDTADNEFCNLSEFASAEYVFHFLPSRLFQSPFGRLNQIQRWRDLIRLDLLARHIAGEIDKKEYDVIYAQPCMWTQAPLVLRYLHTLAVYYCQEPPRHLYESHLGTLGSRSWWRRKLDAIDPLLWMYRFTARRFDYLAMRSAKLVLVNSIFSRDQVKRIYGIEPSICYFGVDTDVFYPHAENGKGSYVLSVGAIQPHKGYDFLIESLGCINKKIRPSLHLVGNMKNSDDLDVLQALAREKDVDLHIDVGIDLKKLIQKYNEAILVAYAPYNEPFGLVPLESMACGRPVVGVCEGGVMETVLDHHTGILVERDPRKFADAVQFLMEHPDLADQFGRNGREHVLLHWSWERSITELEQYFSTLF